MSNIPALQDAIRNLYCCESQHLETVPMTESFEGRTVWNSKVEVFNLMDHPQAKRCYAWSYQKDSGIDRTVAVLDLPPIDSAKTAVQAAIIAEFQKTS